jgi:uncharacterized membrane protein (UPF0127 family)
LLSRPDETWGLFNFSTGRLLSRQAIPAFDRTARNRGLLGLNAIDAGSALVLAPCSGIHTFFMRFPIDVIFVARDGTVLGVRPHVSPWRLTMRVGAFAAIETAAGACAGIAPGDRLSLVTKSF